MDTLPPRESMEFDVVVVGAGPAGLAAATRLKQLSPDISVVVVEKGSEVGAHIMSGAVIDPSGLDALLPEWRGEDTPIKTAVSADRFYALGASGALRLPLSLMPPLLLELWREQHPKGHEQVQLDFRAMKPPARPPAALQR